MAEAQQASSANRRLAQQMANRPTAGSTENQKGLKQRLGRTNVKARLNLSAVRGRGRGGGGGFNRGQRGGGRGQRGGSRGGPGGDAMSPR
ncbi:chromatin target of PRMT1 protein-like, partial [Saccostrea cucullata]|uniref:chromatin target of PRMT1 protein-like n=1 Tax=Saccostrea cuccullata TaxID=36930 RepID=UPI002ED07F76